MNADFVMVLIGVIHSPFMEPTGMPIQPVFSRAVGRVEVLPEYAEGLQDLEAFSHVILIYALHRSEGYSLRVKPFLDDVARGLFATRYPRRPNPIGLSTVRLLSRRDNVLEVEGIDVLDGTPLLDIKPYVPEFDSKADAYAGWYDSRPADKEGRS
jgi:tRNA-Thr(GGU) m(6)t(6)A37 methyltransferase TsaA